MVRPHDEPRGSPPTGSRTYLACTRVGARQTCTMSHSREKLVWSTWCRAKPRRATSAVMHRSWCPRPAFPADRTGAGGYVVALDLHAAGRLGLRESQMGGTAGHGSRRCQCFLVVETGGSRDGLPCCGILVAGKHRLSTSSRGLKPTTPVPVEGQESRLLGASPSAVRLLRINVESVALLGAHSRRVARPIRFRTADEPLLGKRASDQMRYPSMSKHATAPRRGAYKRGPSKGRRVCPPYS